MKDDDEKIIESQFKWFCKELSYLKHYSLQLKDLGVCLEREAFKPMRIQKMYPHIILLKHHTKSLCEQIEIIRCILNDEEQGESYGL